MMRFLVIFFTAFFLFFPKQASADEGWVIEKFDSNITIEQSGEVKIVETLDVDFNYLSKHGIYRDIPYVYEQDGVKTYTEIDVIGVSQNYEKAKFSTSRNDNYVRLKIGDPDKTISGKNTYQIIYSARGVLRGFAGYDELYWNVTGNNWPVGINSASASVTLPSDGIIKLACFEGYSTSQAECSSASQSGRLAKFNNVTQLGEAEGLTIVVGYEKGKVALLTVERPKGFWEKLTSWPSLATLAAIIVFGGGTIIYLWARGGRDYWFGNGVFGKNNDSGSAKPIGAHETTVVEYTPPEKLRPAEIGVLMDERADTLDVVSTIIDLASRGFLTITEVPKKWIFGKVDYSLNKTTKDTAKLLNYEKMLLNDLFKSGKEIKTSELKQTFYDELKKIKEELYNEVVSKNLFPTNPEKVRNKYLLIAFLMIFLSIFFIGFSVSSGVIFFADLCFGIMFSGILLLFFSRHMPRRSAYGRDLYRRTKGYRLFIDKAEKHRQKFFEKKNLFNEVLPYAIVFGLTEKFAKQMDQIGLQAENPVWYSGVHHFNLHTFAGSMNDFSSSMSSAIATTPSSSGGFSGGGSSGGGFGGGGGGSW